MNRPAVIKGLGAFALATVLTVGGLALAQDDQSEPPPPLVFDDPPADPVATPPVEEPPPAPGEVAPSSDPASPAAPAAPVDAAAAEEDAAEETTVELPAVPLEVQAPTGKRVRHASAIIQALDKITAETIRFEARVGVPVKYRGLVFTVRTCETSSEEEAISDSIAYLQIRAEPRTVTEQQPSREVFRGWMFASSPGLNPLKHPVYDAWVIACKA
jgi:hypothetical protein